MMLHLNLFNVVCSHFTVNCSKSSWNRDPTHRVNTVNGVCISSGVLVLLFFLTFSEEKLKELETKLWRKQKVTGDWVLWGLLNSLFIEVSYFEVTHTYYGGSDVDRSWPCSFLKSKCVRSWYGKVKSSQVLDPVRQLNYRCSLPWCTKEARLRIK